MDTESVTNSAGATKWLTFLVYFLLTVLTFMTGWQQVQVSNVAAKLDFKVSGIDTKFAILPKEYVLKERYLTDRVDLAAQFKRIDEKLDRLIERTIP
ncbi:MAG: hypothetical protein KKD18_06090 [Nanoarchaeota archaeon]|nr:hypothetical protein [Nanoarchaeota archaeon]